MIVTVALARSEALAEFELAQNSLWRVMSLVAAFLRDDLLGRLPS